MNLEVQKFSLSALNPYLICSVCNGYFRFAHTLSECGHTCITITNTSLLNLHNQQDLLPEMSQHTNHKNHSQEGPLPTINSRHALPRVLKRGLNYFGPIIKIIWRKYRLQ